MSAANIADSSAAAMVGLSLVDNSLTEAGELIVLNNPLGVPVHVAGLDDDQQAGEARTVLNRGSFDVVLLAEDAAAPAKNRFTAEKTIGPGEKAFIFYNGLRWEPYTEV
jgi:hypothetical protein